MDLLAIFSTLRRHLLVVAVLALVVVIGDGYVLFGIPPTYESQAQYVLISPPAPPTDAQIEKDPALAKLNDNNPYLRLPSSVVVDVLAQRMSGDAVRRELIAEGADRDYQVTSTNSIGNGLVVQILGTGHSAYQARHTLDLVVLKLKSELQTMQTIDGADQRFLYQALPINAPTDATRKITGTVRSLIAVTAAGLILLFGCVSILEALPPRRRGAAAKRAGSGSRSDGESRSGIPAAAGSPPVRLPSSVLSSRAARRADGLAVDGPDSELTMILPRSAKGIVATGTPPDRQGGAPERPMGVADRRPR